MKPNLPPLRSLLTAVLWAGFTLQTLASYDAYLRIEGVPGEAGDANHKEDIYVLSWSWGLSQSGTTGGLGTTNKAAFQDLRITKWIDKASPKLMLACAGGTNIAQAELVFRYPGGTNQVEYLKILLENVQVRSVRTFGESESGAPIPTEEITLAYTKLRMTYQPVGATGAASGPPVVGSWDLVANRP